MAIRVVVTLVCVGLSLAAVLLPSPLANEQMGADLASFLDSLSYAGSYGSISWAPLGIRPFIGGFLLVEIMTLVVPAGRRLRRTGIEGRRTINKAALAAAFAWTWLQAAFMARFITGTFSPWGAPITDSPAWLWTLTIATGTFALAGLALLISRFGLGNGFAVLFVAGLLYWAVADVARALVFDPFTEPENRLMSAIITGLFFGVVVYLYRRARSVEVTPVGPTEEGEEPAPLPIRVPALPQGAAPLSFIYVVPTALTYFPALAGSLWLDPGSFGAILATTVGIVGLSLLGAWLFSAHGRAATHLEGVAEVPKEGWEGAWKTQLVIATAVLVGGLVFPDALHVAGADAIWLLLSVNVVLVLVASALDLWHEGRLVRAAPGGAVAHVATLDNVHLAEYFRARFEREGIPHAVRAFHFRRLFYFLGPLYKMTLLVPEEEAERAAELVEATDLRIV